MNQWITYAAGQIGQLQTAGGTIYRQGPEISPVEVNFPIDTFLATVAAFLLTASVQVPVTLT